MKCYEFEAFTTVESFSDFEIRVSCANGRCCFALGNIEMKTGEGKTLVATCHHICHIDRQKDQFHVIAG